MRFFVLEEWAAANADYDAAQPPVWHAKIVPDVFIGLSGIFWSAAYILMIRQSYQDRSYSMPIYCLCLNGAWETVFGFVYGPGLLNQIVFAQWMIIDVLLVFTTVKFGPRQWKGQPLVGAYLGRIIIFGYVFSVLLLLVIAATYVPLVGRQVTTFTGWTLQVAISIGSIAQLMSRGHVEGHSWAIWLTRSLGTGFMTVSSCWLGYFWCDRYAYMLSPYFVFLFCSSMLFDMMYPFIFWQIWRSRNLQDSNQHRKIK